MSQVSPVEPTPSQLEAAPAAAMVAVALLAVYLIWGSTYLGIRLALEGGFPPFLLGAVRFLIAGALLAVVLRVRGVAMPTRTQWRNSAVVGILLLLGGNGLVNVAEQTVSSGMAAVAVASAPLWMGVFATLRGERPTQLEWIGLAIGFVGVFWLNAGSSLSAKPFGLACLLLAAISWSYGSIWSRGRDLPSPLMAAAAQMLCAGVAMAVLGLLLGERFESLPTPQGLGATAYLIGFGSLLGYSAYVWLLRHVRPALAGSYAYVNPAIAVLLGSVIAGERFGASELLPMAVILAGVVAITIAKAGARKRVPAAPADCKARTGAAT